MTVIGVMCAYQEAAHIGAALQSLLDAGCERLVVVDGAWACFERYTEGPHSTDGTQDIARAYGAEIIEAPPGGWATQVKARNAYFVGQPGDWYFILDADERAVGRLPEDLPGDAYKIWRHTPGMAPDRIMRLVKEDGTLRYCYTHYALYRRGQIIDRATLLDGIVIEHPGRPGDTNRNQRRDVAWARNTAEEQARTVHGWVPDFAVEEWEMDKIAYRYISYDNRWVPGLPARDLTTIEAEIYADMIAENLAGKCPIYEKVDGKPELERIPDAQPATTDVAAAEQAGSRRRRSVTTEE